MKRLYTATAGVLLLCSTALAFNFDFGFRFGNKSGAQYIDLAPSLSWSTNAWEFGSHDVGTTTNHSFTLTNNGTDTAEDVTVSTSLPFRSYSSTVFGNISASRARTVKIQYKPTVAGAHAAMLNYSAPNISPVGVALTGTGVSVGDTTPDAFTFTDQTNVALSTTITSAAITVAGITAPSAISVTGGTYDINSSGSFTASSGSVSNGDTVRAQHTSSSSNSTTVNTVVTIGGVSDTFTSTTTAGASTFSDNFTYSNGALPTVSGSVWLTPSYSNALQVVSNEAKGTAGPALNMAYIPGWASGDDQCSEVKIVSIGLGDAGPSVRVAPSTDSSYWVRGSNSDMRVYKRVAGTETQIASSGTTANGDLLKICAIGTTITTYVNGTLRHTVTDSSVTGGYPGIRITWTDTIFDDFTATGAP